MAPKSSHGQVFWKAIYKRERLESPGWREEGDVSVTAILIISGDMIWWFKMASYGFVGQFTFPLSDGTLINCLLPTKGEVSSGFGSQHVVLYCHWLL